MKKKHFTAEASTSSSSNKQEKAHEAFLKKQVIKIIQGENIGLLTAFGYQRESIFKIKREEIERYLHNQLAEKNKNRYVNRISEILKSPYLYHSPESKVTEQADLELLAGDFFKERPHLNTLQMAMLSIRCRTLMSSLDSPLKGKIQLNECENLPDILKVLQKFLDTYPFIVRYLQEQKEPISEIEKLRNILIQKLSGLEEVYESQLPNSLADFKAQFISYEAEIKKANIRDLVSLFDEALDEPSPDFDKIVQIEQEIKEARSDSSLYFRTGLSLAIIEVAFNNRSGNPDNMALCKNRIIEVQSDIKKHPALGFDYSRVFPLLFFVIAHCLMQENKDWDLIIDTYYILDKVSQHDKLQNVILEKEKSSFYKIMNYLKGTITSLLRYSASTLKKDNTLETENNPTTVNDKSHEKEIREIQAQLSSLLNDEYILRRIERIQPSPATLADQKRQFEESTIRNEAPSSSNAPFFQRKAWEYEYEKSLENALTLTAKSDYLSALTHVDRAISLAQYNDLFKYYHAKFIELSYQLSYLDQLIFEIDITNIKEKFDNNPNDYEMTASYKTKVANSKDALQLVRKYKIYQKIEMTFETIKSLFELLLKAARETNEAPLKKLLNDNLKAISGISELEEKERNFREQMNFIDLFCHITWEQYEPIYVSKKNRSCVKNNPEESPFLKFRQTLKELLSHQPIDGTNLDQKIAQLTDQLEKENDHEELEEKLSEPPPLLQDEELDCYIQLESKEIHYYFGMYLKFDEHQQRLIGRFIQDKNLHSSCQKNKLLSILCSLKKSQLDKLDAILQEAHDKHLLDLNDATVDKEEAEIHEATIYFFQDALCRVCNINPANFFTIPVDYPYLTELIEEFIYKLNQQEKLVILEFTEKFYREMKPDETNLPQFFEAIYNAAKEVMNESLSEPLQDLGEEDLAARPSSSSSRINEDKNRMAKLLKIENLEQYFQNERTRQLR